jgi:hypothetical protein
VSREFSALGLILGSLTRSRGERGGPQLQRAVDSDEEVETALLGVDLRDVDMEVANRVRLETAALRLLAHLR